MQTFKINIKERDVLSKNDKIISYTAGSTLAAIGIYILTTLYQGDKKSLFIIGLGSIIMGVFWIMKAIVGREFSSYEKYVKISDEFIFIKGNKEVFAQIPIKEIKRLSFEKGILHFELNENPLEFDMTWLNYRQIQRLKMKLQEVCWTYRINLY